MQHYHVSAALQCVLKLLGNKLVPCAVPSCAMVLAADRLGLPVFNPADVPREPLVRS